MSYSWSDRVDFIIRYMYDIDNNGQLDQKDFDCMALRACLVEGKGDFNEERHKSYLTMMRALWQEISDLADFDKDGKISSEEFKEAVKQTCVGKKYEEFPKVMKAFIEANFKMMDGDGDDLVSKNEFRYNCISRIAVDDVKIIDAAFEKLLNDEDKKRGGINLARYQQLYGDFIGNTDDKNASVHLFGPLPE
ncbi:sarcoplasmic calcium-binding protein, beta chain [Culicoides brevitarsis]|uniref:sarcoplasmic calcium-binding protein, beta chain n=1 Tax=Culicoides brevitarsis TaxID=469753 RepID=UPI00307BB9A5